MMRSPLTARAAPIDVLAMRAGSQRWADITGESQLELSDCVELILEKTIGQLI